MNDRDIDAEFDAIVAHWDDDAVTPPKPRTVQDITAAYAALSRPEVDSPSRPDQPDGDDTPAAEAAGDEEATAAASGVPSDHAADHTTDNTTAGGSAAEPPGDGAGQAVEPEAWRQGPSVDDEDDHFEPPPVQLPPGEDMGYWGALLGLVGGPLVLLWVILAKPFYAGWWTLGAILMFFGGFALLVLRQPKDRDPFDDDNGARV